MINLVKRLSEISINNISLCIGFERIKNNIFTAKLLHRDILGVNPYWWVESNEEQMFDNFEEIKWENNFGIAHNLDIGW